MAAKQCFNISLALSTVFVNPPILPRLLQRTPRLALHPTVPPIRAFSSSPISLKTVTERRQQNYDEEIPFRRVYVVEADDKLSEIRMKWDVLDSIDRKEYRLVQLTVPDLDPDSPNYHPDPRNFIPVCRIENKREAYQREKERKAKSKEQKKGSARATSVKTLELNWAIDQNDLGHRLEKMEEFLSEGRRVEVVLAAKKRGRKASKEECEGLLGRLREVVERVGGKEFRAFEGELGRFATIVFQGKVVKAGKKEGEGPEKVTEMESDV
ncbi:Translation initiation factor IF-3, N-terminal domain [Teratosphaeria destructans]|uniref:Translation initiation factor IF-3, N-terminal domain n=1 Tax=Teratosphaeria destructans TaxID=418781 RepID=A0A9W7STM9_9PEZI|nr:Translation initiation factor IF-3, N-terminal domain [Teratosphaeria destructans]